MEHQHNLRLLFNETFDALPREVQDRLRALWRKYNVPTEMEAETPRSIPELVVQKVILEVKDQNVGPGALGSFSRSLAEAERLMRSLFIYAQSDGIIFRFKTAIVELAPADILKILIAHELAHAYRAAEVGIKFPEAARIRAVVHCESEVEEEIAASNLMKQWGFEEGRLTRWIQQNHAKVR